MAGKRVGLAARRIPVARTPQRRPALILARRRSGKTRHWRGLRAANARQPAPNGDLRFDVP